MKKFFLLMMVLAIPMITQADGYRYLTIETTSGARVSLPVSGLQLSFSGNALTAGSQSIPLSNLSKMYFSGEVETDNPLSAFVVSVIMSQSPSEDDLRKADINGDGEVNAADLVSLINQSQGNSGAE